MYVLNSPHFLSYSYDVLCFVIKILYYLVICVNTSDVFLSFSENHTKKEGDFTFYPPSFVHFHNMLSEFSISFPHFFSHVLYSYALTSDDYKSNASSSHTARPQGLYP